jgi:hypothetical protein
VGTEWGQKHPLQKIKNGYENSNTHNHLISLVPGAGIEPAQLQEPRDFKSLASTNSATQAYEFTNTRSASAYIIFALHCQGFDIINI